MGDDHSRKQRRYVFGRAVAYVRHARGLTQEGLAELVECDRKSIIRLENGTHAVSIDRLWAITDVLQVRIGDLETISDALARKRQPPPVPPAPGR